MMHVDTLDTTGPNEIAYGTVCRTHSCVPNSHVLAAGAYWRNQANTLNRPCAAAMRPIVKLLWPLVTRKTVRYHLRQHMVWYFALGNFYPNFM